MTCIASNNDSFDRELQSGCLIERMVFNVSLIETSPLTNIGILQRKYVTNSFDR